MITIPRSPSAMRLPRRRHLSPLGWHEARWGLIFLSPWIIGFFAFTLLPMVATFLFTLTNINLNQATPLRFVGLDNYARALADTHPSASLGLTFKLDLLPLPVPV